MSLREQERARMRKLADPGPHGWTDHEWAWYQDDVPTLLDELERVEALLTDPNAFWDAIYPHITEHGPDLCFKDCERITSWLAAHLAGKPGAH